MNITRRSALSAAAAVVAPAQSPQLDAEIVKRHDASVATYVERQITEPINPRCGTFPDAFGLFYDATAGGILDTFMSAYLCPQSKHHKSAALVERMHLAADYLERVQTRDGNITLPITNFNSPPDTAFCVLNVAMAMHNAATHGAPQLATMSERFLKKAGAALARGGIHTPNHRWVVCAALSQIHELYPDASYLRRIDQWLAEGIDIDSDGQYSERSTAVYNGITNRALVTMAIKLNRPQLLDPVRRNLDAMKYLLHAGGEVVTEISRRQDLNQKGTLSGYWLPLRYLALKDNNRQYAAMERLASGSASLSLLLEYPELARTIEPEPLPEDYERYLPFLKIARVRRDLTSATLALEGNDRFLTLRRGEAVINAVRFASAFFGKGQFVPARGEKRYGAWHLEQSMDAPYWQPLDPPRSVGTEDWFTVRRDRRQTEVCQMNYAADIAETTQGFRLRIQASGTRGVPLAVEINLREGGNLEGCEPAPQVSDGWVLPKGHAVYRMGANTIRFGPGSAPHRYTQVRGARPKLPGPSVYITGYTPFDQTIDFECS